LDLVIGHTTTGSTRQLEPLAADRYIDLPIHKIGALSHPFG
jgi:hypothetical protein